MKMQSSGLTINQINAIAEYLQPITSSLSSNQLCTGEFLLESSATWMGWGNSDDQARYQPESVSMINLENISKLELKWVFGVPETGRVRSQPSIAGGLLFFGTQSGLVYALDATKAVSYTHLTLPTILLV